VIAALTGGCGGRLALLPLLTKDINVAGCDVRSAPPAALRTPAFGCCLSAIAHDDPDRLQMRFPPLSTIFA
jgi:hypothetical protein